MSAWLSRLERQLHYWDRQDRERQPHELTDAELAEIAGVDLNDPDLDAKLERIVREARCEQYLLDTPEEPEEAPG